MRRKAESSSKNHLSEFNNSSANKYMNESGMKNQTSFSNHKSRLQDLGESSTFKRQQTFRNEDSHKGSQMTSKKSIPKKLNFSP